MPELPEVETVRRGLESTVNGFTVTHIKIFDKRSLRKNLGSIADFESELVGSEFSRFVRRGKFLWTRLTDDRCLVIHLGMSGQILVTNPNQPREKSERLFLGVSKRDKQLEIRFADQRLFGGVFIDDFVSQGTFGKIPKSVQHIALDPLDKEFNLERAAFLISKRLAGIKSLLMNQRLVSGIGNIYADETLWLAKVHYLTPGISLEVKKITRILEISKMVLESALSQGGTSFDSQYKNINGESGYFSQSLKVYRQTGLPCQRCRTPIRRDPWANRGSHFCPTCQIPKR
jgi:formamidopyrimidine-DNA glycosylase